MNDERRTVNDGTTNGERSARADSERATRTDDFRGLACFERTLA
jgi:hypothetical protein